MARVNTSGPSKSGIQNSSYTYAADAQASDAYAITVSPAPSAYATGQTWLFKANTANTGAGSLNVNGLGAKTIKKNTDQDLATGDIEAGSIVEVVYDGTNMQMVSVGAVAPSTGDVSGPAASIDNELALFSSTTGKVIKRATGTGMVRIDSGVVSIDSDVTDLVSAASDILAGKVELATDAETITGTDTARAVTPANLQAKVASSTVKGIVELAIASEINTGTDTERAVTPDALAGSFAGTKSVQLVAFDFATNTATGDGKAYFRVPASMGGMDLVAVAARVITAGTTNTTDIQIHNLTQAADMLSTKITVDSAETDSSTAATAAVIDASNDDVASGDLLRIDVDAVSTTPAQGLIVSMEFRLP